MDATASGAQEIAGRVFPVSDRPVRGRTMLLTVFDETGRMGTRSGESFGGTGADERNRVVLTPQAGVKPCGDASGPTGLDVSVIRKATVAKVRAHRGDHV